MQVVQLVKVLAASSSATADADGVVRIAPFGRLSSPGLWTRLHQAVFHLPRPWSDNRFRAEFNRLEASGWHWRLARQCEVPGEWLWLAIDKTSDQAIGAIGLRFDDGDVTLGHIRWLMVDPGARRRGVARQLLAVAERTAQHHGIERLRAETASTWHEAIQFYQAHGFT